METKDGPHGADLDALERELTMVRGAIAMVADGAYRSMTLGGLSHGQEVLDALGGEAAAAGADLVPLAGPDGSGPDIRVRPQATRQPRIIR